MRFFDLLSLIIDNLGRRKGRVVLTAIGVVIGTASVVILVSLFFAVFIFAIDHLLSRLLSLLY